MEKIIKKITLISLILTIALSIFSMTSYAMRVDDYLPAPGTKPKAPIPDSPSQSWEVLNTTEEITEAKTKTKPYESPLFPPEFGAISNAQIRAIRNLPNVSIEGLAATAIKTFLGWSMFIALVGIVLAGIYMLIFQGDTTKAEKARNVIQYLVIGAIVVSIAYGIVSGIMQFTFF
jgi:hypothetical protein